MKRLLYLIILFCLVSCTSTDEGMMGVIKYERIYMNQLESIIVMFPDSLGNVSIVKYDNIKRKDIKIRENYVKFPDSSGHYITFINCPIKIEAYE